MEPWSPHHFNRIVTDELGYDTAVKLSSYSQNLRKNELPVIFTLKHLAQIVNVDYGILRSTVERRRETANYRIFAVSKRSGGLRYIHAVCEPLQRTQQFLNAELLQKVRVHPNSYAFQKDGGIRNCAVAHCGARWIFQFDLYNFFYSVSEVNIYRVFCELGYRPLLSLELSRICTTTYLPKSLNYLLGKIDSEKSQYEFYGTSSNLIGILPQGAPSSPMLSNLVAINLDNELSEYCIEKGFVVTRYADDITISSGQDLPNGASVKGIQRSVIGIIRKCGFQENRKKIRVSGPGAKKLVLGLLVDGETPRISREMYKRIDRHLHASKKYGFIDVAAHEGFESPIGFYNHLGGLITFVIDVDPERGKEFKDKFNEITIPWEIERNL